MPCLSGPHAIESEALHSYCENDAPVDLIDNTTLLAMAQITAVWLVRCYTRSDSPDVRFS